MAGYTRAVSTAPAGTAPAGTTPAGTAGIAPAGAAKPARSAKKAQNRRKLLQAAQSLVAEKGFRSVSVMEIAERAGLSTGAIYSNFRSKEALLLELIDWRMADLVGDPTAYPPPGKPKQPAIDYLVDIAVQAGRFVDTPESRQLLVLQVELFLLALRDTVLRTDLAAQEATVAADLARVLDQVGRIPVPKPAPNPEQLAEILMACLQGMQQHRLLSPALVPDELFAWVVRALLSAAHH